MNIELLIGIWLLTGSISINSQIKFFGDEPDPNGIENWLNSNSNNLIAQVEATEGLTLTISSDGKFSEERTGTPKVYWFDKEGVLESEVIPFNGHLSFYDSKVFLLVDDLPSWAVPSDEVNKKKLRYDDGDTKIADSIEVQGEQLIRTISVVTDELYLDRVIVVYKRGNH
ncbi:hypothetical protein I8751_26425 [Nostocaceae cyanobacterium CENA357]|uniref:Uncharacterized protein n=1 Tax=Atlanticothrix silvestris CENA357 TaxID=1725252 RepID=A0A8J7L596_9CYAN|nr:hypothetical protein [Atlanticothrix silvestris]MBH8555819.1 hypothetical protein [Atlanticothrix silvestris CENA357]